MSAANQIHRTGVPRPIETTRSSNGAAMARSTATSNDENIQAAFAEVIISSSP
jgi:hypothetical protein